MESGEIEPDGGRQTEHDAESMHMAYNSYISCQKKTTTPLVTTSYNHYDNTNEEKKVLSHRIPTSLCTASESLHIEIENSISTVHADIKKIRIPISSISSEDN